MKQYCFLIILVFFSCSKEDPNTTSPIPPNTEGLVVENFYIECGEEIPIDNKIPMTLFMSNGDVIYPYEGLIERRGGFSLGFPKHSYELDFTEDLALADLPPDDDWIFNANYIDKTFLRNVLSYELFQSMHPNNLASKSKYIRLDLNQEDQGLYILMEKLDKSTLLFNGDDDASVIFKEPHIFRPSYDNISSQDPNNFHQQTYPKIEEEDKTVFIESVREFILDSSDENFTAEFENHFDLQSIIDWNLLLMITNNSDGILKNFYLYKINNNTPIRIAPWDYDHSFGRDGDNELNLDTRPLDINRSILFERLLTFEWYKTAIKNRWTELNGLNILSVSGLKEQIDTRAFQIQSFAELNFDIWSVSSQWYYDDNGFAQEIKIMNDFVDLRHARLVEYFDNL